MSSIIVNPTRAKRILLVFTALSIAVTALVFAWNRFSQTDADNTFSTENDRPSLSLDKIHQTSVKNGVKQWTLDAATANYFKDQNKVELLELSVVFHMQSSEDATLVARKGQLDTTTKDITATEDVVVRHQGSSITTDKLHYNHEMRIINSDVPVRITARGIEMTADTLTYYLDDNKAGLSGNVKGVICEDIEF